jgi:hypothetical protein
VATIVATVTPGQLASQFCSECGHGGVFGKNFCDSCGVQLPNSGGSNTDDSPSSSPLSWVASSAAEQRQQAIDETTEGTARNPSNHSKQTSVPSWAAAPASSATRPDLSGEDGTLMYFVLSSGRWVVRVRVNAIGAHEDVALKVENFIAAWERGMAACQQTDQENYWSGTPTNSGVKNKKKEKEKGRAQREVVVSFA